VAEYQVTGKSGVLRPRYESGDKAPHEDETQKQDEDNEEELDHLHQFSSSTVLRATTRTVLGGKRETNQTEREGEDCEYAVPDSERIHVIRRLAARADTSFERNA